MKAKLIIFFSIILLSSSVYAVSDSQIATAKVHVESVFEITLDRSDIDFESMRPGQIKYDIPATGIKVTTKCNTNNKWYLLINSLDEMRDGNKYINNNNFYWYGWTSGKGKWFGTGDNTMKITPVTVYEASELETINLPQGTDNFFKFKLEVPADQQPGNYESSIRFTITE
jgi:hypothetical protein